MSGPTSASPLAVRIGPLAAVDADVLVVPWFEGDEVGSVAALDEATGREITRALTAGEFAAKRYDLFVTPVTDRSWTPRRVMLVGAGLRDAATMSLARQLATASVLAGRQRRATSMGFVLRRDVSTAGEAADHGFAQAIAEGLILGAFTVGRYRTKEPVLGPAPRCLVAAPDAAHADEAGLTAAVTRGRILGDACNLARSLANEPGNLLPPREFAARASTIAGEAGVVVEVLDEHRIAELGMGLLLGVTRGSAEPPRLMVFRHDPPGAPAAPVLGLVGKGVTFDTGGISIKSADGMERMKDDMAGGAAVACAMRALAQLGAPIRVVGVVPAVENMPGGRAVKPGDILRSAQGKTVEVINTDAEGRLILGDGLWYARQLGATHLVDVATLTGSVVVALGKSTSGLFGTPESWVECVRQTANRSGDRVWPLPLVDEYRDQLKSEIADIQNTGGRPAGSITAALFLSEFTGGLPWAHLDIAGTAWADEARPYQPKGPTGVAVRTLAELAFTSASWPR